MDRAWAARPSPGASRARGTIGVDEALQAARDGDDEGAWSWGGEDYDLRARQHAERIDRVGADVDLDTRLALIGFMGPGTGSSRPSDPQRPRRHDRLAAHRQDLPQDGRGRRRSASSPRPRRPERPGRNRPGDRGDRPPTFRRRRAVAPKWDPRRCGRTTFFIGQCKICFANIYRTWLEREVSRQRLLDPAD